MIDSASGSSAAAPRASTSRRGIAVCGRQLRYGLSVGLAGNHACSKLGDAARHAATAFRSSNESDNRAKRPELVTGHAQWQESPTTSCTASGLPTALLRRPAAVTLCVDRAIT